MRVGIDAWGLSGGLVYTGVGQYTQHLVTTLASIYPDTTFVAYGAPREPRPEWLPDAVEWRAPEAPGGGRWQALLSRTFALKKHVRADGIDVFHAPGVHARPSLPPIASVDCPLVATVHDIIPLTHYRGDLPARMRLFYRWNLRRALGAQAVVTVSKAALAEIVAHRPNLANKIVAIPNGVDFAPNEDAEPLERLRIRRPYVLFAGSYEPRKNLVRALSAYARLAADGLPHDFVAIVEAESGHANAVRAHLDAPGLRDRVRLVHSLSESDIRALYTHAEALCFPSLAEGFGFPPLQAAACRTPVVASDLPSTRETLGPHAAYVDPLSIDSIADGLRRLFGDEALRTTLVREAAVRAEAYSWGRSARAHMQVYEDAAKPRAADRDRVEANAAR